MIHVSTCCIRGGWRWKAYRAPSRPFGVVFGDFAFSRGLGCVRRRIQRSPHEPWCPSCMAIPATVRRYPLNVRSVVRARKGGRQGPRANRGSRTMFELCHTHSVLKVNKRLRSLVSFWAFRQLEVRRAMLNVEQTNQGETEPVELGNMKPSSWGDQVAFS